MTVPLLLNENFPAPAARALREAGFDVLCVAESCPGTADPVVLEMAVRERRWLITFDRDYGELVFARKCPAPPAVILLRVPSYRPTEPADWVITLVQDQPDRLNRFTVFDGQTVRSRPFLQQVGHEPD
jgi:predicted nuclease of predicted toxin-antitoxin system